jgi:hypothetical protein
MFKIALLDSTSNRRPKRLVFYPLLAFLPEEGRRVQLPKQCNFKIL